MRAQGGQQRPEYEETDLSVSRRDELMYRYGRAAAHYISRPYAGRTALLWPRDEPALPRYDPFARWRQIAPLVDIVRMVPGKHLSSRPSAHRRATSMGAGAMKNPAGP